MNKSAAKIIYIKDMVKIEYMSMLLDVAQNDKDLEIANLVDFLIKKQCKPISQSPIRMFLQGYGATPQLGLRRFLFFRR